MGERWAWEAPPAPLAFVHPIGINHVCPVCRTAPGPEDTTANQTVQDGCPRGRVTKKSLNESWRVWWVGSYGGKAGKGTGEWHFKRMAGFGLLDQVPPEGPHRGEQEPGGYLGKKLPGKG